jgi:hypothetical protein
MHVEDTRDPALGTTRKMESMSDLVAEMILGACEDDEDAAADAAALAAARRVVVESASFASSTAALAVADIDVDIDIDVHLDVDAAWEPSRRRPFVAVVAALGLLALAASAGITFLALR